MIRNLPELLAPHLGKYKVIKDVAYTRLTKPGDNYGSLMLQLDIVIFDNAARKEEILHLVGKTLMESEPLREIFRVQTTYSNEIAFYEIVIPTVLNFQKELGVKDVMKSFAKCYGTRKNLLKDSDVIDDDTVLLFENLVISGYKNIDRTIGFDYDTARLILKDMAQMHAVFLALKLKQPEIFNAKVRPYCENYVPLPQEKMRVFLRKMMEENETCRELVSKLKLWGDTNRSAPREPFATVIHTDLWVNNTMQKFQDGKAIYNKFVDFQVYTYGSPASDVFFFLWTSVQHAVLETNLDDLLKFYYMEFIKVLDNHECDTTPFTYENFLNEIRLESDFEFPHALLFFAIVGIHGVATLEAESDDEISERVSKAPMPYKKKFWYMVQECHRRGWFH